MRKRIPLYDLVTRLDSKERNFIKNYIKNNLNTSSRKNYLNFLDILLKSKNLNDEEILSSLSKNNTLKSYLSEAKFYLNKLIIKALRLHYTINPQKNGDNFLNNVEKQKEIYIYFSKGLYKDARVLCKKYATEWEKSNNFAMLSFVYKKLHQIELLTAKDQAKNKYHELYAKLNDVNSIKSNYYKLSHQVEKDIYALSKIRTAEEKQIFKNYLNLDIMRPTEDVDIYYWYVKILCQFALIDFEGLSNSYQEINRAIDLEQLKAMEVVHQLQLYSRLTFIAIDINDNSYFLQYKSHYYDLLSKSTILTDVHKNMYQLNAKIMESLYLFKQAKYEEMLSIHVPNLDIDNYIFEGAIMLHYVDLLFARAKAYFKLGNFDKAYDYFNFIIEYKVKLKVKAFTVCNAFFHIWLIRYFSKEYKVLPSITNRYKIYLSNQKIDFPLEIGLRKFMYSCSNNYASANILKNKTILQQTLTELCNFPSDKYFIDKLDIASILKDFPIDE